MYIYPYKIGSKSVNGLKEALNAKQIKLENSKFVGSEDKNVIVWGNSYPFDEILKCNYLNNPNNIKLASNKLSFFNHLEGVVSIPDFTEDRQEAHKWLEDGKNVVVREKLTGHSGQGLVIISDQDDWDEYDHGLAKLYTLYIPKKQEYRVHVFRENVFDIQRKAIQNGLSPEEVNFQVRTHNNGFIFVRNEDKKNYPEGLNQLAISTIENLGLDFGAVDIIYNEYRNTLYVLEVNTAPGLENTTLSSYIDVFSEYFDVEKKVNNPLLKDAQEIENMVDQRGPDRAAAVWGVADHVRDLERRQHYNVNVRDDRIFGNRAVQIEPLRDEDLEDF